jgi:hypothetical protein
MQGGNQISFSPLLKDSAENSDITRLNSCFFNQGNLNTWPNIGLERLK